MHFLEQAGWERVLELPGAGGILLAQILDAYLLNRIDHGLRGITCSVLSVPPSISRFRLLSSSRMAT